ncbi:glycosyltransferase [Desulfotalea psychrophila]|uniref:Glycosyltransferase n=1 Tax=Desulfotalea psychrophila TaxID=84980 RepID=A0ABS3AWK7_9BACT|nr:glycosyltransferase [Desulfocapsa sp.]MBN4068381.1 glycosyltransferase [Desulfotalea psychrophila]MBN4071724.1 glycosyltransferase [Desulfotalea psychrophila]
MKLCVVLLNQGRLAEEVKKTGVEIHVVDETQYSFLALSRAVKKLVAAFSPDVIHSHRYKENLLAWLAAFGRSNMSLIATQHGMPETAADEITIGGRLRTTLFLRLLS